jgi:hypothetical protein
LFLGSKESARSIDILKKNQIKYILNCTPTRNVDPEAGVPNFFEKGRFSGFTYKRIPIFDNKGEDLVPHFDAAFRFIEEGSHWGNVLVHCHKGISRSVSFVIAYLIRKNGFTYDEALQYVKSIRPFVQPNEAFERQLRLFETRENPSLISTESKSCNMSLSGPNFPLSVTADTKSSNSECDMQPTNSFLSETVPIKKRPRDLEISSSLSTENNEESAVENEESSVKKIRILESEKMTTIDSSATTTPGNSSSRIELGLGYDSTDGED